jgi:hypothetical protein
METIHKVKVVDKRNIKGIRFKNPELMGKDAERMIKEEYCLLLSAQDELYEARRRVWDLEKQYKKLEQEWRAKQDMFDIEFESTEKEVKTEKSNMTINGALVYSYKH